MSCRALTCSFGGRPLFSNITVGIEEGERIGLIGPNGAGKSTLMRILAGLELADAGDVSGRRNLRVGYVAQVDSFEPGATAISTLVAALEDMPFDEDERVERARLALAKLAANPDEPVESMSGGWRKRLAIARQLLREPDLLLLDEPTNHLDLAGLLWLEHTLRAAPCGIVFVSHDRRFLEGVATRIVELNRRYADGFLSVNGPYSRFLEARTELIEGQAHAETALSARLRGEIEWLHRGAQARSTKAQGRIDQAERMMDELSDLHFRNNQERAAGIDFTASGRKTRELVKARGLCGSAGGRVLFRDLDLVLSPGTRLGLVGPNGSGKTTLLRTLLGDREPDSGAVKHAPGLKVAYLDQAREGLDETILLRDALSPNGEMVDYRGHKMHVVGWAQQFLFDAEQLDRQVGSLSGGERARVLIARLMLEPADVLVMDEPTNDLDIPTLEVLEDRLLDFTGALLLVTHDRYLLDRVCDRLLVLDGVGGATYVADCEQWEQVASRQDELVSKPVKAAAPRPKPVRLTTAEKRELSTMEDDILAAEEEVAELERQLADPEVCSDAERLRACWEAHPKAKERVAALYARWQDLEEKQEATKHK